MLRARVWENGGVTSFGEKLRQAREKKGISLDDIAQTTKIGTRQLLAMEAEDFDKLPGGIFNKGFVRAYARCVGLDEEEAVADYMEAIQESPVAFKADIAVTEFPPEREPVERADRGGPKLVPALVALALFAAVLAGLAWWRTTRSHEPAPAQAVAAPAVQTAQPVTQPQPEPQSQTPATTTPDQGGGTAAPATTQQAAVTPAEKPPVPEPKPAVATPVAEGSTDATATAGIAVRVTAHKGSWMRVQSDDSSPREVTLAANGSAIFRAKTKLTLKLGNAGGVNVSFNGKPLDLQATDGQVKTLNFDTTGLR